MADYRLRVYRRYPEKQMRQVVIYLKPTGSELVQQKAFTIPGTHHEFEVIRLWECPKEDLLQFSGLLPLAILSRTEDKVQTLQDISQRIEALPTQQERSNVAAATYVLAGLVLDKEVIRQILREEIMRDSVTYQDILQQGLQQGRQQGEVALVTRLLKHRFGAIEDGAETRIRALSIDQLEALAEALLDFSQPEDLMHWLDSHQ